MDRDKDMITLAEVIKHLSFFILRTTHNTVLPFTLSHINLSAQPSAKLGLSILSLGNSAQGMGETGMEPSTLWLVDDSLCLLSLVGKYLNMNSKCWHCCYWNKTPWTYLVVWFYSSQDKHFESDMPPFSILLMFHPSLIFCLHKECPRFFPLSQSERGWSSEAFFSPWGSHLTLQQLLLTWIEQVDGVYVCVCVFVCVWICEEVLQKCQVQLISECTF